MEVFKNASIKYPETKEFIQEVCEKKHITAEEVIHFVGFCLDDGCLCLLSVALFWVGEDGLIFHALVAFF